MRPRANAVRPYRHCVTVYVSAKSKFSVRSAEMRRICTGLGRGRRLSTPRPTQIYTLFYALRAVVFACKCGASPYRDNKTVLIPDKSKFSGRSSRNAKNLHRPRRGALCAPAGERSSPLRTLCNCLCVR